MNKSFYRKFLHGIGSVLAVAPEPGSRFFFRRTRSNNTRRAWESVARAWQSTLSETDKSYGLIKQGIVGSRPTVDSVAAVTQGGIRPNGTTSGHTYYNVRIGDKQIFYSVINDCSGRTIDAGIRTQHGEPRV